MAVTETYVDFATGNDYKGATFTDGAYTSGTKTLVKASAFTANKVGHWLYLASNDGGSIVAGYYKIATWSDANTVVLATDAGAGVDDDAAKCIQHNGTALLPFCSIQGALDLITRNATDGDRINVVAGTAQTLSATLSYTTYGTPDSGAQLTIQGCTSSAGDGGIGEIDGAATYSICTAWTYSNFIDLKVGNCGSADVLDLGASSTASNCEIHTSSVFGVDFSGNYCTVLGCYFHDLTGTQAIDNGIVGRILYNYFDCLVTGSVIDGGTGSVIIGNIIDISGADTNVNGINVDGATMTVIGNTIYCSNANTGRGINSSADTLCALNNIIEGWSGSGGDGIETSAYSYIGANAVYNCTNPYTLVATKLNYAIAPNDTLGATPFTDAATNDFSIKNAQTGVTEDAYPSTFRGM